MIKLKYALVMQNIADKYGINISFDTNIEHYLLPDDSETNEENVNIDLTNGSEGL